MIGEIASLAAALCWAVGLNLFRKDVQLVGSRAVNLFKGLFGCSLFLVILLMVGVPYVDHRAISLFAVSGVIGLAVGDSLLFVALARLGAHRTALIASLAPVFAALGAWMFRGELLSLYELAGVSMAMFGVSLVVWLRPQSAEPRSTARQSADAFGIACGVGAALCQAAGVVVSKEAFAGADVPLLSGVLRLGAATMILALFALVRGELDGQLGALFRPPTLKRLVLASLVGTFGGIWLMQIGIANTGSAIASALHSTTPLFTLPIAHFVLKERITPAVAAASCLAVAGVSVLVLS